MQTAPWIKRVDLMNGAMTRLELDPSQRFVTSRTQEHDGAEFENHYAFDGQSWFAVTRGNRQWAIHGTYMSSGSAVYVFMQHPEARHPALESALATDPAMLPVYADWLEEQGDPYAAALKPELLRAGGPAGKWFLEGFERRSQVRFTLREGLVHRVSVGPLDSTKLLDTVHRLVHLRACVALQKMTFDPRALRQSGDVSWPNVFGWGLWTSCHWPKSMQVLSFGKGPTRTEREAFQAILNHAHPRLRVE